MKQQQSITESPANSCQESNRQLISVPFKIFGPFETPIKRERKGEISFPSENATDIFARSGAKAYASNVGCYIMARKFGESFTPLYIGETTRSFAREVFDVDKREKYRLSAKDFPTGKFVLFLLIPDGDVSFGGANAIRDLETKLIEKGKKVNPNLRNKKQVPKSTFWLVDIDKASQGQPRKNIKQFKNMMGY